MKKINLILLAVIYITACSPQTLATPTLTPLPSETLRPVPTSTITLRPTISFTPTATLEPLGVTFDISSDIPMQDIEEIQTGLELARIYLRDYLGGDISSDFQKELTIRIVATGLGDQSLGGGGNCCTFSRNEMYIFFDVKHMHWARTEKPNLFRALSHEHIKIAVHEYIHAWQSSLGCFRNDYNPLGNWMNEGIAEYIAYDITIQQGIITKANVKIFMYNAAKNTGELGLPLQALEANGLGLVWPGHVGYLAVDYLITESKQRTLSLRLICEQIANGETIDNAFKNVFGITRKDSYVKFAEYIKTLVP